MPVDRPRATVLAPLIRGLVIALVAAVLAPSMAAARPLLPEDVAALGGHLSVAVSHQVVVTWARADLGETKAARLAALQERSRTRRVSAAAGKEAEFVRPFGTEGSTAIYRFAEPLGRGAGRTIDQIAQLPGVVAVEPDPWVTADALPADPYADYLWGSLGPGDSTRYGPATYGINAVASWGESRGAGVTIAVIDTGITAHGDLDGQTVPGYDFISDTFTANDGGGRDADPSDPGDWVTTDEATAHGCSPSNSSWHGTHVSGTIAALAGNALGTFGVAPDARILPLRALGKCGGSATDIADAITWAYGGSVSGVPANPNPARVINMSLGGVGACLSYVQAAITNARAAGTVVVVSAGNSGADASQFFPANCSGSLVVAATDIAGKRSIWGSQTSASNYGSIVDVAAPGTQVVSLWNAGTQGPGTATVAAMSGTSMASPHVSGLAALLLEDHPTARVSAIEYAIAHGVTAFPADATAHACAAGANCGLGIANVPAALAALDVAGPTATMTGPASPTNAASLTFTLGFNEPPSGLTLGDLTRGGTATGCTLGALSGGGTSWSVPVSSCSEGTVTLALGALSVVDASGNPGPPSQVTSSPASVDRTAPTSSATIAAESTRGTSVSVDFTASDAMSALASVTAYISASPALTSPEACGTSAGTATSGTISCTIPATDGTYQVYTRATDAAGNQEEAPGTADDAIVRATAAPTVTIAAPASPQLTGGVSFTVTFSAPVTGFAADDIALGGTAAGCTVSGVSGAGTSWIVALAACGEGTVAITVKADSATDGYGSAGPPAPATSSTVTLDGTPPHLVSFALEAASDTGRRADDALTAATFLTYGLVFDEAVRNLTLADLTVGGGTATGCSPALAGSGPRWTVTVGGCANGTGSVRLSPGGSVTDLAGNPLGGPDVQRSFTIDRVAPALAIAAIPASPAGQAGLTLRVSSGEALDCGTVSSAADVDFRATNVASFGAVTGSGTSTCSVPFTAAVADGEEGTVVLAAGASLEIRDDAGNAAKAASGLPIMVLVDRRAPSVVAGAPVATVTSGQPAYTITFSEPVADFRVDDLVLAAAGTATGCAIGVPSDTGDGTTFTVSLTGCSDGTVLLHLVAGGVVDGVGNTGPMADVPFGIVTLDATSPIAGAPSVSLRAGARLSGTSAPVTVAWPAATDTGGTGVSTYQLSRSRDGGASWSTVTTTSARSWATYAPTTGTIRYKVIATDVAGNASGAAASATRSLVLVQQTKAVYAKTWTRRFSSSYSGGSLRYAKAAGATATYTFTGRQIAFVTTRALSRGKVKITVGTTSATKDLKGATAFRWIPWTRTWSTSARRTIRLTVLGTSGRPRVDLDAFVVLR